MFKTFLNIIWILAQIKSNGIGLFIDKVQKNKQKTCDYKMFVQKAQYVNRFCNSRIYSKIFQLGCLKRSLILFYIAHNYGVKLVLEFGSRHIKNLDQEPILSGHAWVKYNEEPFMETLPVSQYIVMYQVSNM